MAKSKIDRKRWRAADGRRFESLTPHATHLEYGRPSLRGTGAPALAARHVGPVAVSVAVAEFQRAVDRHPARPRNVEQLAGRELRRNGPALDGLTRRHRPGDPAGRHRDTPGPVAVPKLRVIPKPDGRG